MNDQQYKYMTPAETLIKMTAKITSTAGSMSAIAGSHYQAKCNYLKMRSLLHLALAGHLGSITDDERARMDGALLKLDELYEKNRKLLRRPPPKNGPQLSIFHVRGAEK